MKRIFFAIAVIFAYPSFGFAEITEEDKLIAVPNRVFLEGVVIGSQATRSDFPIPYRCAF